jgi:hypothetical protein
MPGFLYQTIRMGKKSKTAERQTERERVCERQCVAESEGKCQSKNGQLEETFGDGHV